MAIIPMVMLLLLSTGATTDLDDVRTITRIEVGNLSVLEVEQSLK